MSITAQKSIRRSRRIRSGEDGPPLSRLVRWMRAAWDGSASEHVERRTPRGAFRFEALEPRMLLSADPLLAGVVGSAGLHLNLTEADDSVLVRQVGTASDGGAIVDMSMAGLTQTYGTADSGIQSISVDGLGGNDSFRFIDVTVPTQLHGGSGFDTLLGPNGDTQWNVTGQDSGSVEAVSFDGIEQLVGAADNRDEFVFGSAGALAGGLDGGARGFDTLTFDASGFDGVVSTATGPDSGTLDFDGTLLAYAGLEPIVISNVPDVVIRGTSGDDELELANDPGDPTMLRVSALNGTLESVAFSKAGLVSLTIDALGGNDSIAVNDPVELDGGALVLYAEIIDPDPAGKITGASEVLQFAGHGLNQVIAGVLGSLDRQNLPTGDFVFSSAGGLIPDIVTIGWTLGDGVDLSLENVTLTFAGLAFDAGADSATGSWSAGWSGQVGIEAQKAVLFGGLLDIGISATTDGDAYAVVGVIDLGSAGTTTLYLDDQPNLNPDSLYVPGWLDVDVVDLALDFQNFRLDDDAKSLQFETVFTRLGFDTGDEQLNDYLSGGLPLFKFQLEGSVAVGIAVGTIEDAVEAAAGSDIVGAFKAAVEAAVASDFKGVTASVKSQVLGDSFSGSVIFNTVQDVLYGAIEVSKSDDDPSEEAANSAFEILGRGGNWDVAFALSELGPLQFFFSYSPEKKVKDPVTGLIKLESYKFGSLKLEEFGGGIRFNSTIENLQTFDDPSDITDVLEESGRFLIDANHVEHAPSGAQVTLTIAEHDLAAGDRFRIQGAGNDQYDGDFTVLTVNGDQVIYDAGTPPGPFVGAAQVIRLTIKDPLDLRREGLASGIAPPNDIFAWRDQLDQAVLDQINRDASWGDLKGDVVIGGHAVTSIDGISDNRLRYEVDIMFDSAGHILLVGNEVILDGLVNLPTSLYGDLGELTSGNARFLFLSDVTAVSDDLIDPLLTYRGKVSFETLAGTDVLGASVTEDATPGFWDVTLQVALDNPSADYAVDDVAIVFGADPATFGGTFVVIGVDDASNTITLRSATDPGAWIASTSSARVVNENALAGNFRIDLEGGVDLHIPAVTTLTMEGTTTIEFRLPGSGPDELLMDLLFDARLTESNVGDIGRANGAFHASFDNDVPVTISNPLGGLDFWGAALVTTDLKFLERVGLFAPEVSALLRINTSSAAMPAEVLMDVGGSTVTVDLPAQSFALRLDAEVDFRIDYDLSGSFEADESVFQIDGTFVLELSAEQGFNVAIFRDNEGVVDAAKFRLGPAGAPFLEFNTFAFVAIRSDGIAANLVLSAEQALPLGLASVEAQFVFIVNTTGRDIEFAIPGGAADPNRQDGLTLTVPRAAPTNPSAVLASLSLTDLINGEAWDVAPQAVGAAYGVAFLKGKVELLSAVTLDASGYVLLSEGVQSLEVNVSGEFLSLASVSGSAFISSQGEFAVSVAGQVQLGPDGFNLSGGASLDVSYWDSDMAGSAGDGNMTLSIEGTLNAGGEIFYIDLPTAELTVLYDGDSGDITVKTGAVPVPGIGSKVVDLGWLGSVRVYYPTIEFKPYEFTIGGLALTPQPDPVRLGQVDGNGQLTLNVGSAERRTLRNLQVGTIDEEVLIDRIGAGSVTGDRIRITMFGVSQTFDNVLRILAADMADGRDYVQISSRVGTTVEVHLGAGADTLISDGTGMVLAYGDAGDDNLTGGRGNDELYGGSGVDVIRGGQGRDIVQGGDDDDLLIWSVGDGSDFSFDGEGGRDSLEMTGTDAADLFTIGAAGAGLLIGDGVSSLVVERVELVSLQGRRGADSFMVDDLTGAQVSQVTLELGADAVRDTVVIHGTGGADLYEVSTQKVPGRVLLDNGTPEDPTDDVLQEADALLFAKSGGVSVTVLDAGLGLAGDAITLATGGGADTVAVLSTLAGAVITLDGGAGNDSFIIGRASAATAGTLNAIAGAVSLVGGADADTLTLSDAADDTAGETAGVFSGSQLTGLGLGAGVAYQAMESVNLRLGSAADVLTIRGTAVGALTTINGGGGDDRFYVQAVPAPLTLQGAGGADRFYVSSHAAGGIDPFGAAAGDLGQVTAALSIVTGAGGGGASRDAIYFSAAGSALAITGGALYGASLSGLGNATPIAFETTEGTDLYVGLSGGNDTLRVHGVDTGDTVLVHGGPGQDILNVGDSAGLLAGILGDVNFAGDGGLDTLNVHSASPAQPPGLLTALRLTGLDLGSGAAIVYADSVDLSTVEAVNVFLGSGANVFSVDSTHVSVTTGIHGGGGSDTLRVGTTGSLPYPGTLDLLTHIDGALTFDGGEGEDVVRLNNSGNGADIVGTFSDTSITGLGNAAPILLAGAESVEILLGVGNDSFYVSSTALGSHLTLSTGGGEDTVYLGSSPSQPQAGSLDGLLGSVTVDGGAGALDTLYVNDQTTLTAKAWVVSNTPDLVTVQGVTFDETVVARSGAATIRYQFMEAVSLNAGDGADTIEIQATHRERDSLGGKSASFIVNAGGGADRIVLGQPGPGGALLDGFAVGIGIPSPEAGDGAPVFIDGQAGDDRIEFDHAGGAPAANVNGGFSSRLFTEIVPADQVAQTAQFARLFGEDPAGFDPTAVRFDTLVLSQAGRGGALNVYGRNAENVQLLLGAADDTVQVATGTYQHALTVDGGAGNDSFLLENGADHHGRAVVFNGGADDDLAFVDFSRASIVDRGNLAGTVTGVAVPGAALGTLAAGLPELAGGNYFVETRQSGTSAADWQFRLVDASGAPVTVALLNGGDPTSDWQRIADIAAGNGGLFDTQRGLLVQFGDDPSLYQAGSWSSDPGSRTAAQVLLGVPTAAVHLTFNGGHHSAEGEGDTLRIAGDGSSAGGEYRPNALLANAGTIDLQGNTITFTGVEPLVVHRLPDFKVITPDDPANLSIGAVDVGALNLSELSLHVVTVDGVVTWTQAGELKGAASLGEVRQFASSMAMSANGQFLVVGAERYVDDLGQESGVVFLFSWDAVSATWVETSKLYAPDSDGAGVGAGFGHAVALDGVTPNDPSDLPTIVVVGAPRDTTFAGKAEHGAAYVFSRSGTGWTFQRKLLASDAQANDHFGSAVAAAYEQALVGAPGNGGDIYFFQQQRDGLWAGQATVTNQPVPSGAGYGTAVALISDRAVVALPGQNRAYVFVRNSVSAAPQWQESAQLSVAGLGQASEQLTLDRNNNGRWDAGDGFVDANANGRFDSPEFGYSVALAQLGGGSLQAVLGAPGWNGGAVVRTVADVNVDLSMFLYPASSFEVSLRGPDGTEVILLAQNAAAPGRLLSLGTVLDDEATRSINEPGTSTITGAYRPSQSLSAFDGRSAAGDWVLKVTDKVSGDYAGEFYGWGLSLTFDDGSSERRSLPSTFVYVPDAPAAPLLSSVAVPQGVATQVGKAFVFHGAGANWTRVADLGADSGLAGAAALAAGKSGDRFGESVALLGSNLVVGATGVDHSGVVDAGAAYLFTGSDAWTLAGGPAPVAIKLVGATPNGGGGVRGVADSFGHSVAIGGGRIVVGIPGFDETAGATVLRADVGSVHTFSRVVTDVNVTLNIRHPFNADLDVYLTGPTGKQVELFTDVGGLSANFSGTTLDDQAVASITSGTGPFSGSYRPEGLLGLFNGDSATGTWQLSVTDDDSDFFTPQQSLNSWSLTFTFSDGSVQTFAATTGLGPIPDPGVRTSNLLVPGPASTSLLVPQAIKTAKAGASVAIDGDWAVVGAPDYDNRGAVFIYRRDGPADADGNPDWVYQTLLQPEGIRAGDDFGYSVTLSDGVLAIGSPGSNSDGGLLYIYQRIGDGWSLQFSAAGSPGWRLGQAVDASDNVVVVGAPGFSNGVDQPGIGIAFSYERVEFEWVRKGQYFARAFGAGAGFGTSVAIEGDTVVVGAPGSSIDIDGQTVTTFEQGIPGGGAGAGAVGIFVPAEDGGVKLQQIWTIADGLAGDRFGQSVDISGGRIVAGAPGADRNGISNAGAAYAFSVVDAQYATGALATGSIGPDNIITDVIGLDDRAGLAQGQGALVAQDDFFGHSVAIDGERLVVGAYGRNRMFGAEVRADSGDALAYGLKNGAWRLETDQADEQLFGAGAGSGDQVGYAVAISGDNALLGAPQLAGRLPSGPATDGQGYAFVRTVSPPLTVVTPELQTVLIAGASANTIEGTVGLAAVQTAMLRFFDIEDVTLRTGAGADTIALQEAGLVAHGLVNFYLETGGGNDMLSLQGSQLTPPAAREQFELAQVAGSSADLDYQALIGAFHFDGGAGVDTIASVAGGSWMLEQDRLVAAGDGVLLLTRVEDARLQGGPDGDYFGVRGWQGTLNLDGKEGADTYELFITPGTHITVEDTGVVSFTFATDLAGRPTTTQVAIEDYLLINGTDQGEALVLESAQASVGDSTVRYAGIEKITMAGGGGDDYLRVKSSGARTVELIGQDGNDFYDMSPDAASVAPATLPSSGAQTLQAAGLEMAVAVTVAVRVRDESRNEGDIDTLLKDNLGTGVTLTYDRSIDRFSGALPVSVPDFTASAAQSAGEGQTAFLDLGAFTDATGGPWTVNVDWGDGSALDTFVLTVAGVMPPREHVFAQDGDYTVQVSVRKNVAGSLASASSFTVAVANAAPTLSNLALDATTITEGNLATVRGKVVDAGTLDSFLLAIDWGDGGAGTENIDLSSTAALPANVTFNAATRDFSVTHRYLADNASYAIALSVTDDAGASGTGALALTVLDAGPVAQIAGDAVLSEGATGFYDASSSTSFPDAIVSYAWDLDADGEFDDAVGATASRAFLADGAYDIAVRVTDADGSVSVATLPVTVTDAAPKAALSGTVLLAEGGNGQFDAGASTSSPDGIAGYEWDWDYDGITFAPSGDTGVTQSHVFADDGMVTVAVRVTDSGGSTNVATMQVAVENVAPTVALGGLSTADEGSAFALSLGPITDPGEDSVTAYRIDWDDGSAVQILSAAELAALGGIVTHVYADGGATPTIAVDLVDEDGIHPTAGRLDLTVLNVAPTLVLAGNESVNEGAVYTLSLLDLVDPGTDTLTGISIDWGDGVVGSGALGDNGHTYADDGRYVVTVTLADEDGSYQFTREVSVLNVAPTIALTGAPRAGEQGVYDLTLGAVTDPGDDTVTDYIVDWGDGTRSSYRSAGVVSHVYAPGVSPLKISVDLLDRDGLYQAAGVLDLTVSNTPPVITSGATGSVAENEAIGTVIYTATATDADAGVNGNIIFSLGGADAGLLDIDAAGRVTLKASADYESHQASYSFDVVATDGGTPGLSATQAVVVSVTDVNEAPTAINLSASSIAENNAAGATVATLTAVDPDGAGSGYAGAFTYALVDGDGDTDNDAFTITGDQLTINAPADFEDQGSYSIRVQVTDAADLSYVTTKTITVTDVNEAPEITSGATGSVEENAATSTVIYSATATDGDAGVNGNIIFSLGGADAGLLDIDAAGRVTLKASADYESHQASYSFDVVATDGGTPGLSATQAVVVSVTDVNEAPTAINLSASSIAENNAAGATVATLTAVDPDGAGSGYAGAFTYALVDGDGDTDNDAFTITGDQLTINAPADFEDQGSYSIRVQVTDAADLSYVTTKTITVTDVNEAPEITSGATGSVEENAATSTVIYSATATDGDAGVNGNIIFSLGGADAGLLDIDAAGRVTLKASADYESHQASYSFDVVATDGGTPGLSATQAVVVSVTDVNEAPTAINLSASSIAENNAAGATVATLTAVDPDGAGSGYAGAFTYALVDGDGDTDNDAFTITGDQLTINAPADFEDQGSYSIRVQVTDAADLSYVTTKTITVTDVNEAPEITSGATGSVEENAATSTVIYSATATDGDAGVNGNIIFSLGGADAGLLDIDAAGRVTLKASADYESHQASYSFDVVATDGGTPGLSATQAVVVSVTDVNEAPVLNPIGNRTVDEGDTLTFTASAVDVDAGVNGNVSYSIDAGGPVGATIDPITGAFSWAATDTDGPDTVTLTVRVMDNGNPRLDDFETITITVRNVAPTLTVSQATQDVQLQ